MTVAVIVAVWALALLFFLVLAGGVRRGDGAQRRAVLHDLAPPPPADAPSRSPARVVRAPTALRPESVARAGPAQEAAGQRR